MDIIQDLLKKVKQNKKYSGVSDEIIIPEIISYLTKNKITKITKNDIKEIRSRLHKSYASFQTKKKNKISNYLDDLKVNPDNLEITNKLLEVTLSTKERLNNYEYIYNEIFKITGRPKTILDLGSGLNIFSYPYMDLSKVEYYSYDINETDMKYLNEYYKIMKNEGLSGEAAILDLKNLSKISYLPFADIVFLFKTIDVIDKDSHKPSEELISQLFNKNKTKYIVASFATKTLTRKQMNFPNRKWFELMLERNNFKFQILNTDNEIFYVVYKV